MFQINNQVDITGRLVRDPKVEFIEKLETSKTSFTVAVDRPKKKGQERADADFIPCVVWGKSGETVANFFSKGSLIRVAGKLTSGSYTKKDGTTAYTLDVWVDNWDFVGPKQKSSGNSGGNNGGYRNGGYQNSSGYNNSSSFGNMGEEVPF